MHQVFKPDPSIQSPEEFFEKYDYDEPCPWCESLIPVIVDKNDHEHYAMKCPVCGKDLYLCTICTDDGHDKCWMCQGGKPL